MSEIIDLGARRKPVTYIVTITHDWDGTMSMLVDGVTDDARSRYSVGYAMARLGTLAMEQAKEEGYVPNSDGS